MEIKEIKQLLNGYSYIKFKVDSINENLCNLAVMIESQREVKTPILTGLPKSSNISDTVAKATEKIIDKYCCEVIKYEKELDVLLKQKNYIEELLLFLNPIQRQIIELKYFKKYKWWMVSQVVNYSDKHCERIGKEAIKIIMDKMENK